MAPKICVNIIEDPFVWVMSCLSFAGLQIPFCPLVFDSLIVMCLSVNLFAFTLLKFAELLEYVDLCMNAKLEFLAIISTSIL